MEAVIIVAAVYAAITILTIALIIIIEKISRRE